MPETTLQPAAGIDTYINEDGPTNNHGTATTMVLGYLSDGTNSDLLLKFDLSSVTPGSTIQEAKLSLYVDARPSGGTIDTHIRGILQAGWTEGGATWNTYDGSTAWGTAGAELAGTDIELVEMWPSATIDPAADTTQDFDLTPTVFQKLIDVANYGFKVYGGQRTPSVNRSINFRSSDHATASTRPKLYVRWLEPAGRLVAYRFNAAIPEHKILDSRGAMLQPNEVRPNNWIKTEGLILPTAAAYATLVEDPSVSYIAETEYDDDSSSVRIKTDRNQFAELVIQRLSRLG